jgi:3-hydroxyacyl-[acyl-carrier-protein] dehydratase
MPLYTVTCRHTGEDTATYRLRLNADSEIFKAHFPGHPVMPGACMVQTAMELAEDATGKRLQLTEIKNVKFLAVISPDTTEEMEYTLSHITVTADTVSFLATVRCNDTINAKMSLICKKQLTK